MNLELIKKAILQGFDSACNECTGWGPGTCYIAEIAKELDPEFKYKKPGSCKFNREKVIEKILKISK